MEHYEDWNKVKWKYVAKQKLGSAKEKAKETAKTIGKWCCNHPTEALAIVGTTAAIVGKVGNTIKRHKVENRWYDPSTGMYYDLKRKPNNNQAYEAYVRHSNGEDYAKIYRDMGII